MGSGDSKMTGSVEVVKMAWWTCVVFDDGNRTRSGPFERASIAENIAVALAYADGAVKVTVEMEIPGVGMLSGIDERTQSTFEASLSQGTTRGPFLGGFVDYETLQLMVEAACHATDSDDRALGAVMRAARMALSPSYVRALIAEIRKLASAGPTI